MLKKKNMVADHTSENQEFTDYHYFLSSLLVLGGGQITDSQSMDYNKMDSPFKTVLLG